MHLMIQPGCCHVRLSNVRGYSLLRSILLSRKGSHRSTSYLAADSLARGGCSILVSLMSFTLFAITFQGSDMNCAVIVAQAWSPVRRQKSESAENIGFPV